MKLFTYAISLSLFGVTAIFNNSAFAQCDPVTNLNLAYGKQSLLPTWDSVENAIGYEIAISTTENLPPRGNYTLNNFFPVTGIKPDQKYCVFVRARCKDTNNPASEYVKTCGVVTCSEETPDITTLEIENGDPTKWLAKWKVDAGPGGGYSYALTQSEDEPNRGNLTTDTETRLEQLKPGTKYCFHLRYYCPNSQTFTKWAVKCFTTPQASGITSLSSNDKISVYPNPATNLVTLTMPQINSVHQVAISDVTGKAVHQSETNSAATALDVSLLGKGIYFIRISGKEYNTTEKLVISE